MPDRCDFIVLAYAVRAIAGDHSGDMGAMPIIILPLFRSIDERFAVNDSAVLLVAAAAPKVSNRVLDAAVDHSYADAGTELAGPPGKVCADGRNSLIQSGTYSPIFGNELNFRLAS